jgi:hypothetical protein
MRLHRTISDSGRSVYSILQRLPQPKFVIGQGDEHHLSVYRRSYMRETRCPASALPVHLHQLYMATAEAVHDYCTSVSTMQA